MVDKILNIGKESCDNLILSYKNDLNRDLKGVLSKDINLDSITIKNIVDSLVIEYLNAVEDRIVCNVEKLYNVKVGKEFDRILNELVDIPDYEKFYRGAIFAGTVCIVCLKCANNTLWFFDEVTDYQRNLIIESTDEVLEKNGILNFKFIFDDDKKDDNKHSNQNVNNKEYEEKYSRDYVFNRDNMFLYDYFSISDSSTLEQIKNAYRNLAKKFHPDLNKTSSSEVIFKTINVVYKILSNPESRKKYDLADGIVEFEKEREFLNFKNEINEHFLRDIENACKSSDFTKTPNKDFLIVNYIEKYSVGMNISPRCICNYIDKCYASYIKSTFKNFDNGFIEKNEAENIRNDNAYLNILKDLKVHKNNEETALKKLSKEKSKKTFAWVACIFAVVISIGLYTYYQQELDIAIKENKKILNKMDKYKDKADRYDDVAWFASNSISNNRYFHASTTILKNPKGEWIYLTMDPGYYNYRVSANCSSDVVVDFYTEDDGYAFDYYDTAAIKVTNNSDQIGYITFTNNVNDHEIKVIILP